MDVKIINPFLVSTVNLFAKMFFLEVHAHDPYLMTNLLSHRWEITGLLGITGSTKGVIAIRFPSLLVDKLLKITGIHVTNEEDREDTINGMVGELINIISGNAISSFVNQNIAVSVPIIIQGYDHRINWPKIAPVVGIPFLTKAGNFEVQVCLVSS